MLSGCCTPQPSNDPSAPGRSWTSPRSSPWEWLRVIWCIEHGLLGPPLHLGTPKPRQNACFALLLPSSQMGVRKACLRLGWMRVGKTPWASSLQRKKNNNNLRKRGYQHRSLQNGLQRVNSCCPGSKAAWMRCFIGMSCGRAAGMQGCPAPAAPLPPSSVNT